MTGNLFKVLLCICCIILNVNLNLCHPLICVPNECTLSDPLEGAFSKPLYTSLDRHSVKRNLFISFLGTSNKLSLVTVHLATLSRAAVVAKTEVTQAKCMVYTTTANIG